MRGWSSLLVATAATLLVVEGNREKRYFWVNPDSPTLLGFILALPISLALPALAPKDGRSFTSNNFVGQDDDEWPEDLYWDPAYEEELGRLYTYFAQLMLPTLPCQERLVCELTAEPRAFAPIGQILMKELRLNRGPVQATNSSLMWRYALAEKMGFMGNIEDCASAYPRCPLSSERVLNMPVLKVWQFLSSKLNIQLV